LQEVGGIAKPIDAQMRLGDSRERKAIKRFESDGLVSGDVWLGDGSVLPASGCAFSPQNPASREEARLEEARSPLE
jgi:hypothetical protein